jgi:hypothetical protein
MYHEITTELVYAAAPNGYPVEPLPHFCQPGNRDPHLGLPAERGREKVAANHVQEAPVLSMPPFCGHPHRFRHLEYAGPGPDALAAITSVKHRTA